MMSIFNCLAMSLKSNRMVRAISSRSLITRSATSSALYVCMYVCMYVCTWKKETYMHRGIDVRYCSYIPTYLPAIDVDQDLMICD